MNLDALLMQNEWLFFAGRIAPLVVALCFTVALLSWRRTDRSDRQRLLAETQALGEVSRSLAAHLRALEARLEDRRALAAAADPGARGYDLALQMARNGIAPEEIIRASGVTRHEAQLLSRLHDPARH